MGQSLVRQVRSSEKRQGRTLVQGFGSEKRKKNEPNPGSAVSEFGERTWPNSASQFGLGVR